MVSDHPRRLTETAAVSRSDGVRYRGDVGWRVPSTRHEFQGGYGGPTVYRLTDAQIELARRSIRR
jgi:hypothetical protein